jgi:hypothetical protein
MPLRFEDPPTHRSTALSPYEADLVELKQHPNRWAIIATFPTYPVGNGAEGKASAVVQAIRLGKAAACQPKGSFEAKQRRVDDEHRVYVRYIAEQEQPDA